MQDRKGLLRELQSDLEAQKKLDEAHQAAYSNLILFCDSYLQSVQAMSELQFEEEYDALLLVAASIQIQDELKASHSKELFGFAEFLEKLSGNFDHAFTLHAEIYDELIDWGCFFQKNFDTYESLFKPILKSIDINKQYQDREKKRKDSYEWYVQQKDKTQDNIKKNKTLLYLTPLFFVVPFSLAVVGAIYFACQKDNSMKKGEFFCLFLWGLLISFPLINLITAVCLGRIVKNDLKGYQEKLKTQPALGGLIIAKKSEECNASFTVSEFRNRATKRIQTSGNPFDLNPVDASSTTFSLKTFRKQFKEQNSYSNLKKYAAQGKSKPKKVIDRHTNTEYLDQEQVKREQFYRSWNQATSPPQIGVFFCIPGTKRMSRTISNEVVLLHEKAITAG